MVLLGEKGGGIRVGTVSSRHNQESQRSSLPCSVCPSVNTRRRGFRSRRFFTESTFEIVVSTPLLNQVLLGRLLLWTRRYR